MGVVVAGDLAVAAAQRARLLLRRVRHQPRRTGTVAAAAAVWAPARSTRAVRRRGLHLVRTTRIFLGDSPKAATSWRGRESGSTGIARSRRG